MWEKGIALFKEKREGSSAEKLELEALSVIGELFTGVKGEQVAPHVLGQLQVAMCLSEEAEPAELFQYYQHNPNRLMTAVTLPRTPTKQVPTPGSPELQILPDSQRPISELAKAGKQRQQRKHRSETPDPKAGDTQPKTKKTPPSAGQEVGPSGTAAEGAAKGDIYTGESGRRRPPTRALMAGRAQGTQAPAQPASPASQRPPPQTFTIKTLRDFVLVKRQAEVLEVNNDLKKLRENYTPPTKPKPNLPPFLRGFLIKSIFADFPGLSETDTPGHPSFLISQGNPMPGSDGMTQKVAQRLASWSLSYPQGQDPQTQNPVFVSFNESAFRRLAR